MESLRVFEACARHANFSKAADELGVTPAAVSLRVRNLEAHLGCSLFQRHGPRVALTQTGQRLADQVGRALNDIQRAVADADVRKPVRVTAAPTFASRWLAPRLSSFRSNGEIEVRLEASTDLRDVAGFDVAVRSGLGPWPGLKSLGAFPLERSPMLSPSLAGAVGTPADLLQFELTLDPSWNAWFEAAGVDAGGARYLPVDYRTQDLAALAAASGGCVALLSPGLFAPLLASGQLVQPFERTITGPDAYHVLVAPHAGPAAHDFCAWLTTELARAASPGAVENSDKL